MFDTHFHLYEEDDFNTIYQSALQVGVDHFLLAGTDIEDSKLYTEIAREFEGVYCGIGAHPHEAGAIDSLEEFAKLAASNTDVIKAISEVGLDYFYDHSDRDSQRKVFNDFIDLANDFNLPVVVHCRDAEEDCYEILKSNPPKNGFTLHCFTGTPEWAEKFLELGAYFSVGGILTFNKAQNVRDTFAVIPDDRYFLETDSPYLAPVPYRGKRNQPAYLTGTVAKIAELRDQTKEEVRRNTTENAKKFFRI